METYNLTRISFSNILFNFNNSETLKENRELIFLFWFISHQDCPALVAAATAVPVAKLRAVGTPTIPIAWKVENQEPAGTAAP